MQKSILAVSPNPQFLEQIRSHLEEGGRYRVQGVTTGSDALTLVSSNYFDLAILDAESSDVPFVPFTRDLVDIQPGLKLLVFPPQNNPHHPVLTGLVANGFLNKPFFTPEVSRALKNIFQEVIEEPESEPEPTNDLAKLWMQRPEMGIKRVEQLLGSTTAQTGLLVSQGKVIAGSGPSDDATIQIALNLLANHNINKESMELMRFVPLENEGSELLLYASQLISGVTLVLFYPASSSIQLVRQEVYQVKEEFKQAYPTTSELRRDLDVTAPAQENEIQGTTIENMPSAVTTAEVAEPRDEELIPLEDEIGSDELDSILSQIELKNLDAMLADMPAPDPDLASPSVEGEPEEQPGIIEELRESSTWVPFAEFLDEESTANTQPSEFAEEKPETELIPEDTTDTDAAIPPPLPEEFKQAQALADTTEPASIEPASALAFDSDAVEPLGQNDENAEPGQAEAETSPTTNDFDFSLPWESDEKESEKQIAEPIEEAGAINQTEVDFSAWVENSPNSVPVSETGGETSLTHNEEAPEMDFSFEPSPAEEEIANLIGENEYPAELPDTETEPVEPLPEEDQFPRVIETAYEPQPVVGSTYDAVDDVSNSVESAGVVNDQPPPLPLESYNTRLSTEPGTSPLGIRNFRFHYTCLLIPRDPKQFLTRDLSERLSFLLPQLHLEFGLRLTGITIRPQYMLWSVSLPVDVCPIHTVRELRRRTTAHITSNFTDLSPLGNGDDFWAPGFLILSGYTSPAIGMIYDFISQTRYQQSLSH